MVNDVMKILKLCWFQVLVLCSIARVKIRKTLDRELMLVYLGNFNKHPFSGKWIN